jgi:hypothetical protein
MIPIRQIDIGGKAQIDIGDVTDQLDFGKAQLDIGKALRQIDFGKAQIDIGDEAEAYLASLIVAEA